MAQSSSNCTVVHTDAGQYQGQQGLTYFSGISAETAGAQHLCLHSLTIPAGGRARAHLHASHESAIYVISGQAQMWWGPRLNELVVVGPGDFLYIPAGMPHLPMNLSATEPCVGIVARTDPSEQESLVLLPELEALINFA